jgi:hypothetical protein
VWERVSIFLRDHRRRIAAVVLLVFVVVVGLDLSQTVPRETHLALDLGGDHAEVRSIALSYTSGDELALEARRRYPDGAPDRLRESLDLMPGHYDVRMHLVYADGRIRTREGQFDVPAEGIVVVQWAD